MTIRVELQPSWQLWPLWYLEWDYREWIACVRCVNGGFYARRALTVLLELPFCVLRIALPAWWTTTGHYHGSA